MRAGKVDSSMCARLLMSQTPGCTVNCAPVACCVAPGAAATAAGGVDAMVAAGVADVAVAGGGGCRGGCGGCLRRELYRRRVILVAQIGKVQRNGPGAEQQPRDHLAGLGLFKGGRVP
jgi:poly(3-hydroxybutyrate) depolymerase